MRPAFLRIALVGLAAAICLAAAAGRRPSTASAQSPIVKILTPPDYWGAYAIWGSTGSDSHGHIWIGLTSNDDKSGSAHLYEFDPAARAFTDRGDVVAELERLGLRRPREIQMKIHSRIVQAQDEYQYFSSMDETGEEDDGSKLPSWGGHLWRRGGGPGWEHLAGTREALIAVATGGPCVYALGYFNHVLYQFDIRTKRIRSVTIGSAGGHVSRNFFVDGRGHAFVPRVTQAGMNPPAAFLVELDPSLRELSAQPLGEYFEGRPAGSHGMVAVDSDPTGSWLFATGKGRLYKVEPKPDGPATLTDLGWFHPSGPRYVASMFRDVRTGTLYGVASPNGDGTTHFEWVAHPTDGAATAATFPYGTAPNFPASAVLYGSMTHDAAGRFYVVGSMNFKPLILQVSLSGG